MKRTVTYLLLVLLAAASLQAQAPCPAATNKGTDFWFMFLYNMNINTGTWDSHRSLIVAGEQNSSIHVDGPSGLSQSFNLTGGGYDDSHEYGVNTLIIATPFDGGYHLTSDMPIFAYTRNFIRETHDMATLLPSGTLGTRYIVQDYPSQQYGGEVGFVAVEDNTVLTMTVPCDIHNTSITAGTTLTPTLMQGQAYLLLGVGSLSGMEVTSNGKPFAMFQGAWNPSVPENSGGRDHMYEQALPPENWGTDFIVMSAASQNVNHIRITASDDNCVVTCNGENLGTLAAGQTITYSCTRAENYAITTSKPALVVLYLGSYSVSGNHGDPASVIIPPLDRGVCESRFVLHNTNNISSHYIYIICDTAYSDGLTLDNTSLTSYTNVLFNGHRLYRINTTSGGHKLENSDGPFVAYAFGTGYYEGYAFPLGFRLDTVPWTEPEQVHDTAEYRDTVCQNSAYEGYGFSVGSTETVHSGLLERWRSESIGDTIHHYHLLLTVLPLSYRDTTAYVILGDTLFFLGDTLTQAATYTYAFTAANGCDSLVLLHLNYQEISLEVSADGLCPGDSATITAHGTFYAYWTADPPDPDLEAQQGQTTITVAPDTTTRYTLCSAEGGNMLTSIVIGVEPPPALCLELSRPFIDFDFPVVIFTDCSDGSASSTWRFSDGITINNATARRQFHHPLPDSVGVTLESCNRWNCCADTTFTIQSRIRSVWFPNVFTPGEATNDRFGCIASFEIEEYELYIYNRQGLLIYHTTDPAATWDGTRDGQPCPQGTYAYTWHVRDALDYNHTGAGTVTLLR